jgi:hypothetical protein
MTQKIKVSTDKLYLFIQEHNLTMYILSVYMDVSESIVRGCFKHDLNRHGKPLQFSEANILKLNDALPRIAADLRRCILTFGSPRTFTNRCGSVYDPEVAEQIKDGMSRFFNIRALTERVLGWNNQKCRARLASVGHITYGHVTREDVDRLNDELVSVAGVLDSYEVVAHVHC